ncbi:dethiobiotin synthase [Sporosarcina sp. P3]|uniref:dethiobiotin synthase n=1 Tax=Sporosarcina sp. P3 TaxID=2048245 RepID=UPI000C165894|nr:dethiobiotin synthase [Sporosarcina sp. P3]PID23153.1 dethiobiotin synthase [Sporosarcina sp. P3]
MSILFITGTDTDAGKTVATVLLSDFLSDNGRNFVPFKPIQTGAVIHNDSFAAPDVMTYQLASGQEQLSPDYLFTTPCSPHLAASLEDVHIDINKLTQTVKKRSESYDGIVVEGAGGLYVPLTSEGYCMIDWMAELKAPVVLVARAGVGTINHTLLSIESMKVRGIRIAGLLFNDLAQDSPTIIRDNVEMIYKLSGIPVIGVIPYQKDIQEMLTDSEMKKECYKEWDYTILEEALQSGRKSITQEK